MLRQLIPLFFLISCASASPPPQGADLKAARQARDRAEMQVLRAEIAKQEKMAAETATFEGYLLLATLQDWMCEAAYGRQDTDAVREAAQAGVAAAKKAVELNPASSEAHRLHGHLLGNLIPHVFAGGMRYGQASVTAVETAMRLDPKNAEAYISRAISFHFTPALFGGDEQKAVEMLEKAVQIDPQSDTARIWLAQVYLAQHKKDLALREIKEALRLNPERRYAEYVEMLVSGKLKR